MDSSASKFELYFDISATETPAFTKLVPMNLDYDQGETIDTWNDLCSSIANNVKTAIDPTWSTSFKYDKADPVAQFLIAKEYSVGAAATVDVKMINLLKGGNGKQLTFTATLSGISYSAITEEVLQIDFDLKVFKNTTFNEVDYVAPSV